MDITIQLSEKSYAAIERAARKEGRTPTEALQDALMAWLIPRARASWPDEFVNSQGCPDCPPLEWDRPGPEALSPDPFEDIR